MAQVETKQLLERVMERINARLPPPPADWVEPTRDDPSQDEQPTQQDGTPTQYAGEFLVAMSMQSIPRL
jgi:hypothetical protein